MYSRRHREFYRKQRLADAGELLLWRGLAVAHLNVETGALTQNEDECARHLMVVVEPLAPRGECLRRRRPRRE